MDKEELRELIHLDEKIETKRRQLERLMKTRLSIKGIDYSKDRVQTSSHSGQEDLIIKIIDLEREINRDIDILINLKMKARVKIDQVGGVYGVILQMRYLENRNWVEISRTLNYSPKHIFKLHGKALQLISKVDTK